MKKLLILLLLVFILGCSSASGGGPTRHTTFLGVDLGMSFSEVAAILGTGTYNSAGSAVGGTILFYSYGGPKYVGFIDNVAREIATTTTGFSIEEISIGSTRSFVQDKIGTTDNNSNTTTQYNWWYEDRNITVSVNKSSDLVVTIGIYDPDYAAPY